MSAPLERGRRTVVCLLTQPKMPYGFVPIWCLPPAWLLALGLRNVDVPIARITVGDDPEPR